MNTPVRVFCDFDGSLAEITARPQDAKPVPGAVSLLEQLTSRCSVAIVSGRRVSFLEEHFPSPSVDLYGLYGIEARVNGGYSMRVDDPDRWIAVVADAGAALDEQIPVGATVEVKGLSLTVHFRGIPRGAQNVLDLAANAADTFNLELRPARMSVELHPPIEINKGTVVTEVSTGRGTSIYIGDDVGDLPAFDGLDELESQGHRVVRVAVDSSEAPDELLARADVVVSGPEGVLEYLREL